MGTYPEHEKLTDTVRAEIHAINEFLEFAQDKGWFLTESANDGSTWTVPGRDVEAAIHEIYRIDHDTFLREQQDMHDELCAAADTAADR